MSIDRVLSRLVRFALAHELIENSDRFFAYNSLLDLLQIEAPPSGFSDSEQGECLPASATPLLQTLCDYAVAHGIIQDTAARRDLFSTRIMGIFWARPSVISEKFAALESEHGAAAATDWFYNQCRMGDYIKVDAINKNIRFFSPSEYGELEITINLSKPEKDPHDIAALLTKKSVEYPQCMLCIENEGYAGRVDFPARQTLRTIPLTLDHKLWHMQYSPYLYYNEHCIIFNDEHRPMCISQETFSRLVEFLTKFPHYFIGSNADLPIVGGSILNHDHFQGGNYHFPMEKAPTYAECEHPAYQDVACSLVSWPLTTLRLSSTNTEQLVSLADHVLTAWRAYSDDSVGVRAFTGETPHNTITPIARRDGDRYVIDLVLRNNRTTDELPLGIFHPHPDLHHIKKENIGLIEVMGLFILPGRLEKERAIIKDILCADVGLDALESSDTLRSHGEWVHEMMEKYTLSVSREDADHILNEELTKKCARVLYDAGVFKLNSEGKSAMHRFLTSIGFAYD